MREPKQDLFMRHDRRGRRAEPIERAVQPVHVIVHGFEDASRLIGEVLLPEPRILEIRPYFETRELKQIDVRMVPRHIARRRLEAAAGQRPPE